MKRNRSIEKMIKETFIELAATFNGKYSSKTEILRGVQWSSFPVTIHTLKFDYKGQEITLVYDIGQSNVGKLFCKVYLTRNFPNFKIDRKSHFEMLFKKNKNAWNIECENDQIKQKIETFLVQTGIVALSNSTAFEPTIQGAKNEQHYELFTHYHLEFEGIENSILPLINFYLKMIDLLKRN